MKLDIGIVYSNLVKYGGSETYLLECINRWQRFANITLYVQSINNGLLWEYGVARNKINISILPKLPASDNSLLHSLMLMPRLWEPCIKHHDVYLLGNYPAQFTRKRPAVHLIHEPLRMLYDRRAMQMHGQTEQTVHVYPHLDYHGDTGEKLAAEFDLIGQFDAGTAFDKIVTSSHKTSTYIDLVYGRCADLVVYPGVAPPLEPTTADIVKRAVFAGNLWSHKRVDLLIEAIALIPDGELIIVGDGPERERLGIMAKKLNVADRVHFPGRVPQKELQQIYSTSVCGVYVPENEPFGMMPLDVAATGRPSVVTHGGGYTEILDDSSAVVVAPTPIRIAAALRNLFSDSRLADALGREAREKVKPLRWDHTAEKIMKMLREQAHHSRLTVVKKPLYGAHYYPWYRDGDHPRHWNENRRYTTVDNPPLSGPYDSANAETVKCHLSLANAAGLDHFIINLHIQPDGVHEHDVIATRQLFTQCNEVEFRLSIMFVIETNDPHIIERSIRSILEEFSGQRAYLKLKNRASVWYFLTAQLIGYFYNYSHIFNDLNGNFCTIATGASPYRRTLPEHLRQRFNGWAPYSPLQISSPDNRRDTWINSYQDFHTDSNSNSVRVFTICPGYDDTGLDCPIRQQQSERAWSREDGRVFSLMQDVALELDPPPDIITLTSFNEFHENTHIEPCVTYGHDYIESSMSFRNQIADTQARKVEN